MKASNMNTHIGKISIDNDVIARFAGTVAYECFGIVGMAGVNISEGIVKLLRKDAMTKGINVTVSKDGKLNIDFHVIVSYGVNIRTVCDNLIQSVRYRVEDFTGMEVEKINIYVEGVRLID